MKRQFWAVRIKYFDSGRVKVNLYRVEAATKPQNVMTDNKLCDHYIDYFDTYECAYEWYKQAERAYKEESRK